MLTFAAIIENQLTDGSTVYNLNIGNTDDGYVELRCDSEESAQRTLDAILSNTDALPIDK